MIVRFWGTRGSLPAPITPTQIEQRLREVILGLPDHLDTQDPAAVCAYLKTLPPLLRGTAGGNTPCVQVRAGGHTIIIDAGSGIRELGWNLMEGPCGQGQGSLDLLITHLHWDHIQGFPMFSPAFVPGNRIRVYGVHDVQSAFQQQQQLPFWPVSLDDMGADIEFIRLQPGQPFHIGSVRVNTMLSHHPGDSYIYRLQDQHCTMIHASDAEYQQLDENTLQPFIDFFRNADALIFDAPYTLSDVWQEKFDWGHSSPMIGLDIARASGVKKLLIFHHDPTCSDSDLQKIQSDVMTYQAQDSSRPICEVMVTHEGLTLDLAPLGAIDLHFSPDGEAAILTPSYTFDQYGVAQIARQLARSAEFAASPIIDLSNVSALTTAGLQALVSLHQQRRSVPIILAAPAPSVRQVIELSGYMDHFALYPSLQTALDAVQTRKALNLPGELIHSRYRLENKLDERPLGSLLKATDSISQCPVTLKFLSPAFSPETVDRLDQQVPKILALNHPNIIPVIDWVREQDLAFLVEPFTSGPSLLHLLNDGHPQPTPPLPPDQAMQIALDITRALEYAHSRGVIHGDLNPQNIILSESGAVLSGFGLGLLEQGRNLLELPLLFLSPYYLAPEQILGQHLDARSDLYALGAILYQLFTGRPPFDGSKQEILNAHLQQQPLPPRQLNPSISQPLEHLILKLLTKNPNERYASARQTRRISSSLLVGPEDLLVQRQSQLFGRQQHLQFLQGLWRSAQSGQGQLALISGEPGIGKSRLAQQVAAQSQTLVRLIGRCELRQGGPAYALFSQILRDYFATVPPEFFDQKSRQLCAHFVHLVPDMRHMLPDLPDPPPLEPQHEQLRLMSSLTQFIQRATQERPWLLILDDLHWADPASIDLLHYLARHLQHMALLIVGTYSEPDLQRDHPLLATLRDLSSLPCFHQVTLSRLERPDVARLLEDIWQQPLPQTLVQFIFEHSGGNPLYVEELAKVLEDDGLVTLQQGQWSFPDLQELRLPQSIREVVWRRIGHLTPDTQTLLSQAAVLGQTFRFDALRHMSGLSDWQLLEHLDIALERQLVQEIPGHNNILRFHHPEIQLVLYADLGPLRRRMLHRQAAETLEGLSLPQSNAEELAHHLREAGEFERALSYSLQAAGQAQAAYANDTALLWFQRTLEMLQALDRQNVPQWHDQSLAAHQGLGEVLSLRGQYDQAIEHYAAARKLLESLPAEPARARRLADLCRRTANIFEDRGQQDLALLWLERGLGYL
ncbi:MAG: AAA family ATPase, partial [Chloroflexia bacterium]|nr:AAA family ATPase [Chloroflexia bacterium]